MKKNSLNIIWACHLFLAVSLFHFSNFKKGITSLYDEVFILRYREAKTSKKARPPLKITATINGPLQCFIVAFDHAIQYERVMPSEPH